MPWSTSSSRARAAALALGEEPLLQVREPSAPSGRAPPGRSTLPPSKPGRRARCRSSARSTGPGAHRSRSLTRARPSARPAPPRALRRALACSALAVAARSPCASSPSGDHGSPVRTEPPLVRWVRFVRRALLLRLGARRRLVGSTGTLDGVDRVSMAAPTAAGGVPTYRRRRTAPTTRSGSTAAHPLPDPRSGWQPHGVHGPQPGLRPRAAYALGRRPAWRGAPACSARSVYELHVGTFTPEGTLDAAVGTARPPRRPRRRRRRADAAGRLPRPARLGLRRRAPVRRARAVRRPGRPAAVRRRLPPAAASASASTSSTTTSARAATTCRASAPTSPTSTTPPGAPASTSTTRAATRCGAGSSTTPCAGCATSTSTRCAWTPCMPSSTTPPAPPGAAGRRGRTRCPTRCTGRSTLIAESRPQRPAPPSTRRRAPAASGMTAQWSDDFHHALHALLTGERQGYYADFGPLAARARRPSPGCFRHAGAGRRSAARDWGRPVDPADARRDAVPRLPADPRPGRQPGPRRPARRRR